MAQTYQLFEVPAFKIPSNWTPTVRDNCLVLNKPTDNDSATLVRNKEGYFKECGHNSNNKKIMIHCQK